MGPAPPKDSHPGASTTIGIDEVVDRPDASPPALAHGSEEHDYDALLLEYLRDTRADEGKADLVLGRVLLVDAVEGRRQVLHEMLVAAGYDVTDARSGEAAFHAVADASFDLVLADNALPDVSGDDLRVAVQKVRAGVPVLVMTDDRRVLGGGVADLGARGYVEKPVRGLVLLGSLERALASRGS